MTSDLFVKGSDYQKIYREVFNFHEKYAKPKSADDWAAVTIAAAALSNMFPHKYEFVLGLCNAILNEIERVNLLEKGTRLI